jgi:hypothetical protein
MPETGLLRAMPKPMQWLAKTRFMKWIMKGVGVTQGSISFSGASLAKVAADPAFKNGSGKYFQSNNGALSDTRSSKLSCDEQRAPKLWNDSKTLVRCSQTKSPFSCGDNGQEIDYRRATASKNGNKIVVLGKNEK